jgi:hypothetical protein
LAAIPLPAEQIKIPARTRLRFTPAKALKESILGQPILTWRLNLPSRKKLHTQILFNKLVQDPRLRGVLSNYIKAGKWGHIFDGDPDDFPARCAAGGGGVCDARPGGAGGSRGGTSTELILHGCESRMGGAPTFIYVDEAWRMLIDESLV